MRILVFAFVLILVAPLSYGGIVLDSPTPLRVQPGEALKFFLLAEGSKPERIWMEVIGYPGFRQPLVLTEEKGKTLDRIEVKFDTVRSSGAFLEPGSYRLRIRDSKDGRTFLVIPFSIQSPEGFHATRLSAVLDAHWRYLETHGAFRVHGNSTQTNNLIGAECSGGSQLDGNIPWPFSQVVIDGSDIFVERRHVRLGNDGLPVYIGAAQGAVLSAPMRLFRGRELLNSVERFEFTKMFKSCVQWRNVLEGSESKFLLIGSLSYDGLLRIKITSMDEQSSGSVKLILPLALGTSPDLVWRPLRSRKDSFPGGPDYRAVRLPVGQRKWPASHLYVIDDDVRGIAIISESLRVFGSDDKPVKTYCGKQSCQVAIHLTVNRSEPTILALHILPVKDMPSAKRLQSFNALYIPNADYLFRFGWTKKKSFARSRGAYDRTSAPLTLGDETSIDRAVVDGLKTIIVHQGWTQWQGYPGPSSPQDERALRKLVGFAHNKGLRVLVYVGLELSMAVPEWRKLAPQVAALPLRFGRRRGEVRSIRPAGGSKAYAEFLDHHLRQLRDDFGIDGVFLDLVPQALPTANQYAGYGYVQSDGKLQVDLPLLGNRALLEKIYKIFHKPDEPAGIVACHVSGPFQPSQAFCDFIIAGEEEVAAMRKNRLLDIDDVMPADEFGMVYDVFVRGVPVVWMSKPRRNGAAVREISSRLLANGILPRGQWPHFIDKKSQTSMLMPAEDAVWAWRQWQPRLLRLIAQGRRKDLIKYHSADSPQ